MLKIYLSNSSGTPKCLTYIVTIAMFDISKLTSMKKNQKVMVAEVVYLLGAYARNPARCNRRVGGLCSCVSYQLVYLEVRYVKLNLARFHHISSACNSTSVEAIHYP